jgi:hypothetical protein
VPDVDEQRIEQSVITFAEFMSYDDPDAVTRLLRNGNPGEMDCYLKGIANLATLVEKIAALLRLRLPDDCAKQRAALVVEDMNRIRFKLNLEVPSTALRLHAKGLRVPIHYLIPDTGWTVNRKEPSHALEGTHLDHGDLVRLSKACDIGRRLVRNEWPTRFQHGLKNPVQHLDTINEVWWLSRFVNPTDIQKADRASRGGPLPDWCFTVKGGNTAVRVNLEVKRRCGDIKRHLRLRKRSDLFDDIASKFPNRSLTGINVGAVTIYSAIKDELEEHARQWIEDHPTVDALILWSEQSTCSPPLVFVTRGDLEFLLNDCLCPPDEEDTSGVALFKHLIPNYPGFPCVATFAE